MNDTEDAAAPPSGAGPAVTAEQVRDVRRLRRSVHDRKVAGVAGGLGRHLDVDPTLIRVLFVVMCFFGGAGFLLYAALWLLVPKDGRDRAAISAGAETQRVLIIAAGAVAVLLVLGHGWGGMGAGWPLGLVALGFVVYLVLRDRRREADHLPAGSYAGTVGHGGADGPVETEPSAAWSLPRYTPPPPRPPGRRLRLFLPTLAVIAVSLAGLAGLDTSGSDVPSTAYPALALAIAGAALVIGAFVGRPGGVILIGLVSALALAVGSVTGGFSDGRQIRATPTSAALVKPSYTFGNGEVDLDLTRVADLDQLEGRDIAIRGGAGHVLVTVPDDLTVDVDADISVAGGIDIGTVSNGGGFGPDASETLAGTPGSPTVHLDLDLRVGEIEVRQR